MRITSLEEARRYPNAALTMEADSGGQSLATCLVAHIGASSEALAQLLIDLEAITWGHGIDYADHCPYPSEALMYYELLDPGRDLAAGFGRVTDGLWLHPELDDELLLRPQITDVFSGRVSRLNVQPGFPKSPLPNLEETQRYPYGRVRLVSGIRGWTLVDCPASFVLISEVELHRLLHSIDARMRQPLSWGNKPPHDAPARVDFVISRPHPRVDPVRLHPESIVGHWRDEIIAALRGERPFESC